MLPHFFDPIQRSKFVDIHEMDFIVRTKFLSEIWLKLAAWEPPQLAEVTAVL